MKTTEPNVHGPGSLMTSLEQMSSVLAALPDLAFLLSRSGKYVAVFGGLDHRYYHDSSGLVGSYISEVITAEKAAWFLKKIDEALQSQELLIEEYELSSKEVKSLPDKEPERVICFEARIHALDFTVDNEDIVLWVASNISRRHKLELKLRELCDKDQLTGLFNRRRLERDLALHYETFARYSVPTSVLLFDLDNLKMINDTYGHYAGDKAIITVANTCLSQLRSTDIAYRLGGDEFVIVLPNIALEEAAQFADRLRESFQLELNEFCIEDKRATVSIGVTSILLVDKSYEATLNRADGALYNAKRNGKNKVISA